MDNQTKLRLGKRTLAIAVFAQLMASLGWYNDLPTWLVLINALGAGAFLYPAWRLSH